MTVFDELGDIYAEINSRYAALELQARARGFTRLENKILKKRKLNDQAYFLFMFTRLEDRISSRATVLIDKKCLQISNYQNKRVWDMLKLKNDAHRLPLKDKTSLLVPFGGADYTLISSYYALRNTIAHGGTVAAINISTVLIDMQNLYRAFA